MPSQTGYYVRGGQEVFNEWTKPIKCENLFIDDPLRVKLLSQRPLASYQLMAES